nr:transcription initiation factor tfiid subunit 9 [Quercus suber]
MATASPQTNGVGPSTPPTSAPSNIEQTNGTATASAGPTSRDDVPDVPLTSLTDSGDSKRPRDARLIHLVLASLGIQSYQERVPLQLLDFAYRYTSSVLSDSVRLSAEGYAGSTADQRTAGGRGNKANEAAGADGITVQALRQAIASRQGYTFAGALPKEFMLQQAVERNRIGLPKVENRGYGVQLPDEKYCLTGVGWSLKEEWDSEEEILESNGAQRMAAPVGDRSQDDEDMGGIDAGAEEDDDGDEEGAGRMEDVFGDSQGGDETMADA